MNLKLQKEVSRHRQWGKMSFLVLVDISNFSFLGNIHGPLLLPTSWMLGVQKEAVMAHLSVFQAVSQRVLQRAGSSPTTPLTTPVGDDWEDFWTTEPLSLLCGPLINVGTVALKLVSTGDCAENEQKDSHASLVACYELKTFKTQSREVSFVSAFQIVININWLC